MEKIKDYLISYDISENRKRSRIGKVLENYGRRVQKSVFSCSLTKKQLFELKVKLKQIFQENYQDAGDDSILVLVAREEEIVRCSGRTKVLFEKRDYEII